MITERRESDFRMFGGRTMIAYRIRVWVGTMSTTPRNLGIWTNGIDTGGKDTSQDSMDQFISLKWEAIVV